MKYWTVGLCLAFSFVSIVNASGLEPSCTPELNGLITGSQTMVVDGDTIYLYRGAGGIEIITKDAGEFVNVGAFMDSAFKDQTLNFGSRSISASGDLVAATGNDWKSVMLIDVSNPASPVLMETVEILPGDSDIHSVGLDENTLFVMSNNWFRAFDVSDPASPVQLSHTAFIGTHFEFEVGDGFVVTSRQGTIKIYDVSDPSAPSLAAQIPGSFFDLSGDQLYAGGTNPGELWINVYDLSVSLSSPVLLGSATDSFPTDFLSVSSISYADGMLTIPASVQKSSESIGIVWDVSDPTQMTKLYDAGLFDPLATGEPVLYQLAEFDGEVLFLWDGRLWAYNDLAIDFSMSHRYGKTAVRPIMKRNGNLVVWDRGSILVGPDAPIDQFEAVSTLELFQSSPLIPHYTAFFADSADGYLYVCHENPHGTAADDLSVHSIDLDAPGGPVLVDSEFEFLGQPKDMVYKDGVLYIVEYRLNQILVVETLPGGDLSTITVGANSVVVSTIPGLLKAGDGVLYLGAYVYDLANPLAPVFVTTISDFSSRPPLTIVGDHLYGNTIDGGGYDVYDLSNPLSPIKEIGTSVAIPADARFHAEADGILYFVSGDQLITVDVRNPSNQLVRETAMFSPNGSSPLAYGRTSGIIDTSLYFTDLSSTERVSAFGIGSCMIADCPADLTGEGALDFFDVSAFLSAFAAQDPAADFTNDGNFDFFDVSAFLTAFANGCP